MADVTVVIPTYERPDLLRSAIGSVLSQTYGNFVISIGDNSDSDITEQMLVEFNDPRISYRRNRPGLGAQGNWLDLIERATTPLVATLHDDDLWESDYLAAMVPPMLENPDIAMNFCDFWLMGAAGEVLTEITEHESARTHRSSLPSGRLSYTKAEGLRLVAAWNAPQPAYAAVLSRQAVLDSNIPDSIAPLYDVWLSYQLVKRGAPLHYQSRRLTYYRLHGYSHTSVGFSLAEDEVFGRIVNENVHKPELQTVLGEVRAYWAGLRWARATRWMRYPNSANKSRREFRAAAADLGPIKGLAAHAAGRIPAVWYGIRYLRKNLPTRGDTFYDERAAVPT